ncbi:MAG TPA: glycosyltransferase family A protein [Actinospica sp.]|nr:glycosyltransferase family A protein [Actinospica sp.]
MRIAYVCRDLAVDDLLGSGARTFAAASAMSRAGHDVLLVSEALASPRQDALPWVRVAPAPADLRFFTERLEYADRVYRTLTELHREAALDAVELTPAEAITTIRAKRLLGEFSSTALCVRPDSDIADAANFDDAIASFAARYALEHADALLAESAPRGGSAVVARAGSRRMADPDPARTAWFLGDLRPDAGLETFLAAAEAVLRRERDFRFFVAGRDTDTDPFGRSYWRHVTRRVSTELAAALTFVGPPREGVTPLAGTRCVTSAAACQSAASAWLAAELGLVTIPAAHSSADEVADALLDEDATAAAIIEPVRAGAFDGAFAADRAAEELAAVYREHRMPREVRATGAGGLVSVVIPLWNQGEHLEDAVESARASTYRDVEIVVVDDGSTDPETIAAFDALQGVVKVRQRNAGLSAARNAGIAAASGEFVVPLDADDLLPAGFIAAALGAFHRNPHLTCITGHLRYFGLLDYTHVPVGHVPGLSLVLNTHARATGVFRKSAIEAVGGYDEELPAFEDWDLYLSLAAAGYQSDVLPMVGQHYRRHLDSMTFSSSNAMRLPLLQYLLRKHAPKATAGDAVELPLLLAHLWKTGYESSASVLLQASSTGLPSAAEEE